MRTFSNDFRSSLNEIRQLNGTVCYYSTDGYYILTTESGDYLATEDENYLATEKGYITYDAEAINSIRPIFNVNLFKTICKAIEIEAVHKIDKGIPVCAKIGVLVNGTYEYMDYGNYKIIDEPTYQADTKSYLMVGYDKMIESMVKYDDNPLSITYPITHRNLVIAICNHFNWAYNLGNYTNYDKTIDTDLYLGQDMTYRDVLDDLCQATGTNFLFTLADVFTTKDITETNTTIDDNYIKDINVNFGEKYGKVNALTITSEGTTVIDNKEDSTSISENGKTEFNINNNKLLLYASELFIDDLFDKINGLEYYTYDIDTTGLLVYEPLDRFTINHNGVDYSCVMFNNDIQLTQGLKEIIYTDKPEETENEYISNAIDDKKINNAIVSINKAKAEIILKVDSNGKIAQVRLDGDADDGTTFDVKADNINLEGYTTVNQGFKIDIDGNAEMRNAKMNGGKIQLSDDGNINDAEILVYDKTEATIEERTIQVGDVLGGKTLKLNFPSTAGSLMGGSEVLIKTTQGSIKYYGRSAGGFEETVYIKKDNDPTFQVFLYMRWNYSVELNLTEYTLPMDFGTVTEIHTGGAFNYIKADFINPKKYNKISSTNIGIVDENDGINANYGSHGFTITDEYGNKWFNQNGILYNTNYGPDYVEFNVNKECLIYHIAGGLKLEVDENGCTSTAFNQSSLEEMKKNFEKFKNALPIIKNIDIYKYNLKTEDDKHKKHIGFVIGKKYNYSSEITAINKDGKEIGVDNYSFISLCCQAIKELNEKVEKLEVKIEELESDK